MVLIAQVVLKFARKYVGKKKKISVILLLLLSTSLTHGNPQRHNIFHGIRPIERKDRSI